MSYRPTQTIKIDSATGAQMTVDYPHHEIHSGSAYYASDVQSISTTTYKWGITTPNTTKWLHMIFNAQGTGEMLLTVIEDPATYSGGSAWASINANRNSGNASGAVLLRGITSTGGTTIYTVRTGDTAGGTGAHTSGEAGTRPELILRQNEQYVFQIQTFAATFGSLGLAWYEHTDVA